MANFNGYYNSNPFGQPMPTMPPKRFNPNTGASDFFEFAIKTEQPQAAPEYVTRGEFEELKAMINRKAGKKTKEGAEDE